MFSLVLGGNKSGKSAWGLELLGKEKGPAGLVVTGRAMDVEFNEQIMMHKASRQPGLPVMETDVHLGRCLSSFRAGADAVLVDSIDFWVFNVFSSADPEKHIEDFFSSLEIWQGRRLIFVSAEVGLGPVPSTPFLRGFVRLPGQVNQRLAAECAEVSLIVAGLAVRIK